MRKTIIFDLDGTLMDSLKDLAISVNHCMELFGAPPCTEEEVRGRVGRGIYVLLDQCLPGGKESPDFDACTTEFSIYYKDHMFDHSRAYPGVLPMLDRLKTEGYRTAIVSNKFDAAVKEISDRFYSGRIEVAIGEAEKQGIRKKPAPDTVFAAMRELQVAQDDCIYVGDSEVDLQTAANAGIPCVSVTWGYKTRAFLEENGAVCITDTVEELLQLLLEQSWIPPISDGK